MKLNELNFDDLVIWVQKHASLILISICLLGGTNCCIKSCNKNQTINKQSKELIINDSIIRTQVDSIINLNSKLVEYKGLLDIEKSHNAIYSNIATGNQKLLIDELTKLRNDNISLNRNINKLKREITNYKTELEKYQENIEKN